MVKLNHETDGRIIFKRFLKEVQDINLTELAQGRVQWRFFCDNED
jgi:hypothetical protein